LNNLNGIVAKGHFTNVITVIPRTRLKDGRKSTIVETVLTVRVPYQWAGIREKEKGKSFILPSFSFYHLLRGCLQQSCLFQLDYVPL
jgi:hypothetical protein